MEGSTFYRDLGRWDEAMTLLRLVAADNHDVWGTPAEFYYTLAYCARRSKEGGSDGSEFERAARGDRNVDRYPFREEGKTVLGEAVERDPDDTTALYLLGCLQYFRGEPEAAIRNWERAVRISPEDFSLQRALGLALLEQGAEWTQAREHLDNAVKLNPSHLPTLNDLSTAYARAGRFDEQIELLERGLETSPESDTLAENLIGVYVATGRFDEAKRVIAEHQFQPRHRTYGLRDKYRFLQYGLGARAFGAGNYVEALTQFQSALDLPLSLGMDDFQFESTPRVHYYIGRTLEELGRKAEAREAYQKSIDGLEKLTGDWDSLNVETFYMALALERLGREAEARELLGRLDGFARGQFNTTQTHRRAASRYLAGLVKKHAGATSEARGLMEEGLRIEPDLILLRLELRGDPIDPWLSQP
jgi:tetratricopeptide (TPR) repeat protein